MTSDPNAEEWAKLSVLPYKRDRYSEDLYFREGWEDVVDIFGQRALGVLSETAMLNVKPDAVVGRRMGMVLDYLVDHGFIPAVTTTFGFTRHSMREVWRYDWHVYPVSRLNFTTWWYTSNDVALFLLRDRKLDGNLPGTVRLSSLKGVGDPAKRNATHMRTALAPPNRILNFVHVADEPADIVRELAIFFDRPERRRLLLDLRTDFDDDRTREAVAQIELLEARHPAHDLDVEAAVARAAASPAVGEHNAERIRGLLSQEHKVSWDELCSLVPPDGAGVGRWDFIVIASWLLEPERGLTAGLMPEVSPRDWTR